MSINQTKNCYFVVLLIFLQVVLIYANNYRVEITDDAPIVRGGTVFFTALLYDGYELADGSFEFSWSDDALPRHDISIKSTNPVVNWTVQYDHFTYSPGPYEVQVVVKKFILEPLGYTITSNRKRFEITDSLNGQLSLYQENTTRTSFVSTADALLYTVNLTKPDAAYISNATSITSYWFIDCIYYGPIEGMSFTKHFLTADETHEVEVLVVADFTPLPPKPVPTTTIRPNVTTVSPNVTTTIKPNVTIPVHNKNDKLTLSTTITPPVTPWWLSTNKWEITSRNESHQLIKVNIGGKLVKYNGSFPYVCNGTNIAIDDNKTYGYFSSKISTKDPITGVNITGNNWLEHGKLLELNVICNGSMQMKYCYKFYLGHYNITGNETCDKYYQINPCNFQVQRYLSSSIHTLIIIIENDVSKVIKPVTVTIYEVKKQAQLSVVVVPVAFSMVAVVLVIFGVAYYIQNRSRFLVEVADFDFGVDNTDLTTEYKTFKERLRDSFVNAFTRDPSPESSEPPMWPPGQKYGSMT